LEFLKKKGLLRWL